MKALGPAPWDVDVWYDPPVAGEQPACVLEMTLHVSSGSAGQLDMAEPTVDFDATCIVTHP